MNWNDPSARGRLLQQVGPAAYNELFKRHREASTLRTVAGHAIRPVQTRFGRLFHVGETRMAFATLAQAEAYAEAHPAQ